MQENNKKLLDLFFSEEWDSIVQPHLCSAEKLVSTSNYHIFLEYAYADAFLKKSTMLSFWKDIYINIQKKYSLDSSIEKFDALINSIQKNGFDKMYPIPVDLNYNLIDGSHRLSIALALGITPYVYVCRKKSTPFPKENFHFLSKEAIQKLEEIEAYLMQKELKKIENKQVFYFKQRDLNFWDQIVSNTTVCSESFFFIKHLNFEILNSENLLTNNQKKLFKEQLGILITPYTKAEIIRFLGTLPHPHQSNFLSKYINVKKILHLS